MYGINNIIIKLKFYQIKSHIKGWNIIAKMIVNKIIIIENPKTPLPIIIPVNYFHSNIYWSPNLLFAFFLFFLKSKTYLKLQIF